MIHAIIMEQDTHLTETSIEVVTSSGNFEISWTRTMSSVPSFTALREVWNPTKFLRTEYFGVFRVIFREHIVDKNRVDQSIGICGCRSSLERFVPSDFSDSLNNLVDGDDFLCTDLFGLHFLQLWGVFDPLKLPAKFQVELIKTSWRRRRVTRHHGQSLVSGSDTDRFEPCADAIERGLVYWHIPIPNILFCDAHVTCVFSHYFDDKKKFVRNVFILVYIVCNMQ
jgi:hypothetical protein